MAGRHEAPERADRDPRLTSALRNRTRERERGGRHAAAEEAAEFPPVWNPGRNPPAMSKTPLSRAVSHGTAWPAVTAEIPYRQESPPERRRRRWVTALAYVLLAAAVLFGAQFLRSDRPRDRITVPPVPRPSAAAAVPKPTVSHAAVGTAGTFRYVPGYGKVLGRGGPIRRFRVAVEQPASAGTAAGFAGQIDRILGDGSSWIAGKRFRLQRVPISAHAEFTIYLASARTSERMCRTGGLETGAYTSCRIPSQVIINDDRWEGAVRGYGAPLATYRAYAINHEVGHQIGYGHELCPGKGRPAPVMMQQTLGLKGCVANSWPYLNGRRYAGPTVR
jgi:hypothetical protein